MTGKTPTEPSVTHQLPIRVGQETQQSSFAKRPNQQAIAVQSLQTRTGHSWRPIAGQPVLSTGSGHSWQPVKGQPVSSTGSGHPWQAVTEHPVSSTGSGHSWQAVTEHPVSSTGSGYSWQAVTEHPVSSTGSGHSWQPVKGQPVLATAKGHSWQPVKEHPVSSTGSGHSWRPIKERPVSSTAKGHSWQPVSGIRSTLHVIEPVNRSWKTGREGAITCELCAYTTERKEKYVEHLQCHITQRYMCKICGRACLKVKVFIIFFIINCHIFLLYFSGARQQTQQANDPRKDAENNDSRKDAENRPSEKTTASNIEKSATPAAKPNSKNPESDEVVEIMTDLGITIANQLDPTVVKRIRDFYNSEAKKAETAKCLRHLNIWWKTRKVRRFECASCYYQTDEPEKYKQHFMCHGLQFTCKLCTRKCLEVNECFSWCLGALFTLN